MIELTANRAVSLVIPTFTHPSSLASVARRKFVGAKRCRSRDAPDRRPRILVWRRHTSKPASSAGIHPVVERDGLDLGGAGGERSEPPATPPRASASRSELGDELIEQAVGDARLAQALGRLDEQERERLAAELLGEVGERRGERVDEQAREVLTDGLIDGLIAGKCGEKEILGADGVLGGLTRRLVQRALAEELSEHLGYPAGHAPSGGAGNSRNGSTPKTLLTRPTRSRRSTARSARSSNPRQLPRRGLSPQAAVSVDHPRAAQVATHLQLELGADRSRLACSSITHPYFQRDILNPLLTSI